MLQKALVADTVSNIAKAGIAKRETPKLPAISAKSYSVALVLVLNGGGLTVGKPAMTVPVNWNGELALK